MRMTSQVDQEHSVQLDIVDMYVQLVGGGGLLYRRQCTAEEILYFLLFLSSPWRENSLSNTSQPSRAVVHKAFLLFILQAAKRLASSLGTWWDCKSADMSLIGRRSSQLSTVLWCMIPTRAC